MLLRVRRGFTLIEVMLAIALLLVLVGAASNLAWTLAERTSTLATSAKHARGGDLLINAINDELLVCVAWEDEQAASGVSIGPSSLSITSRMTAGAPPRDPFDNGLVISRYTLGSDGRLTRESKRIHGGDSQTETLAEDVREFRVRAFDGQAWRSDRDAAPQSAQAAGLPTAIEVSVWFGRDRPAAPVSLPLGSAIASDELGEPDRLRIIAVPDAGTSADGVGGPP